MDEAKKPDEFIAQWKRTAAALPDEEAWDKWDILIDIVNETVNETVLGVAGRGIDQQRCKNTEHPLFISSSHDGYCRQCSLHRLELENRGWRFLFTLFSGIVIAYVIFA